MGQLYFSTDLWAHKKPMFYPQGKDIGSCNSTNKY